MKIALLGYGRMGQTIEKIAIDRGHTIVAKIDKDNPDEAYEADVAINFSIPTAAYENITSAIHKKIPRLGLLPFSNILTTIGKLIIYLYCCIMIFGVMPRASNLLFDRV